MMMQRRLLHKSLPRLEFLRFYSGFSSYEYPWATEAPEISKTTAKEAAEQENPMAISQLRKTHPNDHETAHWTLEDINTIRNQQKKVLNTKVSSLPITSTVPSHIPPNQTDHLEEPETLVTTLSNGVRVVSQETYGQVSTVGVVCDVGSRYETQSNAGVTHLLEVLAFGSCQARTALQVTESLLQWGGTRFCNTGREQSLYCIDLLRPNVDHAVELLSQVLLEPLFLEDELMHAKRALEYASMELPPELHLSDALFQGAFGSDQQMGRPHVGIAPQELSRDTVHDFWQAQCVQHPHGLVVAGAGVQHDALVELATRHFGSMVTNEDDDDDHHHQRVKVQVSKYKGGIYAKVTPTMDGLTRVAVALPVGGWHSSDLVPACVWQTLLGGGSSFSAGGPGKGMYSRLYRQVLNRYSWAESAEAVTSFGLEAGLLGIQGSCVPNKAHDMVHVFCEHLSRLAEPVTDEELDRARNMLKCNVLTQLESRLVLFEDLGRQVLTYGKREDIHTTCGKIASTTAQDLQDVAKRALAQAPTVAVVGDDVGLDYNTVKRWLT